jgi:hypothetical protein
MAEAKKGDTEREAAEKRMADARVTLAAAAQEAAEAGSGLAAATMRDIPDVIVEVLPNNSVSHNDKTYYGVGYPFAPDGHTKADTLKLEGPTAMALMASGHVVIQGTA